MASDGISGSVDTLNIQIRVDGVERATRDLDGLARSLNELQMISNLMEGQRIMDEALRDAENIKEVGDQADRAASKMSIFRQTISTMGASFKRTAKHLGTFVSSLKRIAMYRFLRSIIRSITSAVSEGITNIYQYSRIMGTSFAPAMDRAKSALTTFKNSIGAALAPLIESMIPVLQQVCAWLVKFNNLLGAVFASIAGKSTYSAAVDTTVQWGEALSSAAGSAKELKRQLLGFDELNVLSDNASGGGGGGGKTTPDYASMFEERAVPNALAEWIDSLKLVFNDVVLDWHDLNQEQIAEKILSGILTFCGLVVGGIPGAAIAFGLSLLANEFLFDGDGKISKDEWRKLVEGAFGLVGGALVGFVVGGAPGLAVGATLGLALNLFGDNIKLNDNGLTLMDVFFTPRAVKNLWDEFTGWYDRTVHPWRENIKKEWEESPVGNWFSETWETVKQGFKDVTGAFAGFFLGEDNQFSIENIFGIKVGEGFKSLPGEVRDKMSEIKTNLSTGWGKIQSWWNTTASPKISSIWDTVSGFWNDIVMAPVNGLDSVQQTASTKGDGIRQTIREKFESARDKVSQVWNDITTNTGTKWEEIKGNLKTKAEGAKENVVTAFQNLPGKVGEIWEQVKSFFKDPFKGTNAGAKAESVKNTVVGAFKNMPTNIGGIWEQVKQTVNNGLAGTTVGQKAQEIKDSVTTAFGNMRQSVIDAFLKIQQKVKEPINGVIGFINKLIFGVVSGMNKMISKLNSLTFTIPQWLNLLIPGSGGQKFSLNIKNLGYPPQISYLAGGGIVQHSGQLFIARERGAELVGTYGNKTGVMNNDQIVESVSEGVYRAVVEALGSQSTTVQIDGKTLFEIVTARNNDTVRRTGRSPLLV